MRSPNAELRLKFHSHKNSSIRRGIDFLISFDEWLDIWIKSGHLDERGRGYGKYCMSRYNDIGPYSITNVSIKLNEDNFKEVPREKLGTKGKIPWNKGIPRTKHQKDLQSKKMKENHQRKLQIC